MNEGYIYLCDVTAFEKNNCVILKIFAKTLAVLKLSDNDYQLIEAQCKHQKADLLTGREHSLDSFVVACPRHGWKYDLKDGCCDQEGSLPLKIFPIEVRESKIYGKIFES